MGLYGYFGGPQRFLLFFSIFTTLGVQKRLRIANFIGIKKNCVILIDMNNNKETILHIAQENKVIDFDGILNQLDNYPIYIENKRELADILSELEADKQIIYASNRYWATQHLTTQTGWITPGAKAGVFFTTEKPTLELGANYTLAEDKAYSLITKRGAIPAQEVECYMVPVEENILAAYTKRVIATNTFEFVGVLERDKIKAFIKGFELELGTNILDPDDAADYQPGDWGHFKYVPASQEGQSLARLELLEHITQHNKKGFESEIGSYLVAQALKTLADQDHHSDSQDNVAQGLTSSASNNSTSLVYKDLTSLPFFTVDGLNTRDIDDAITWKAEGDNQRLLVAIADVSATITPGSAEDKDAFAKTSSFYFPHKTQHMLPADKAEQEFSLNPGVEKKVMVADLLFSPAGELLSEDFYPATINSKARLTYDDVDRAFEDKPFQESTFLIGGRLEKASGANLQSVVLSRKPEVAAITEQLPRVLALRLATEAWKDKLRLEGETQNATQATPTLPTEATKSLALQLSRDDTYRPARVEWRLDEQGEIESLVLEAEAGPAQKIVEFSMVAANISAARFIHAKYPTTALFRNQVLTPQGEKTKPAFYAAQVSGHSGLATDFYTHFTSPIRRYCDLVVHRILKESLTGQRTLSETQLEKIAAHINEVAVRSKATDTKISQFMTNRYIERLYKAGRTMFETKLVDFFEHGAVFRSPEHIEFFVPAFKVDRLLGEKIYNFLQHSPDKPIDNTKLFLQEVNALSYPIELIDIDPVLDKKMAGPKREPRFVRGGPGPKR